MFLFKKSRAKSIRAKKIGNYLLYGVGEILLIVAGVYIALNFENRNIESQLERELRSVYETMAIDLAQDTLEIQASIDYFESNEWMYTLIQSGEMTQEIMDTSITVKYAAIMTRNMIFRDRGFNLLNSNAEFNSTRSDYLNEHIVDYYDHAQHHTEGITIRQLLKDADDNVNHWKFNYDWFHNFESNQAFVDYALNDPEYLNMIRKHHFLIYENYLPDLRRTKIDATELIDYIERKLGSMPC